jgi:hypothetical protein
VEGVTDKPEPRRLVSVRAVAAESTSVRGRWVLPSVEVWSDSVDIHVVWPETGLDSASHIEYALSDDLGTKYEAPVEWVVEVTAPGVVSSGHSLPRCHQALGV